MQHARHTQKSLQILTAISPGHGGVSGIGVAASGLGGATLGTIREEARGGSDELYLRAILRALELGRRLHAENVSILCPDEATVALANGEARLEPGSPLTPTYIRVRALMHSYRFSEVRLAARSRVEQARRLAVSAGRMPVRTTTPIPA